MLNEKNAKVWAGMRKGKGGKGEQRDITLTDVDDDRAVIGGVDQATSGRAEKEGVTCELIPLKAQ